MLTQEQWIKETQLDGKTDYLVALHSSLAFTPTSQEIIYISTGTHCAIDDFLAVHYHEVADLFAARGYQFIYLPRLIGSLTPERLCYNYPNVAGRHIPTNAANDAAYSIYQSIFDHALTPLDRTPQLIRYKHLETVVSRYAYPDTGRDKNFNIFSHVAIPTDVPSEELRLFFYDYVDTVGGGCAFYSLAKPKKDEDTADFYFESKVRELQEEIKERVEQLRQLGVTEMAIRSLVDLPPLKPSQLHITQDYRLFLTDYGNREIRMEVLPKVLFFFYLNHPEGVRFKQLSEHKSELMEYYKLLSNRVDLAKMAASIDSITDPTKNAVNEKCSLLRSAFIREFDESVVKPYIITSDEDYLKRITLDRALVLDESGIVTKLASK